MENKTEEEFVKVTFDLTNQSESEKNIQTDPILEKQKLISGTINKGTPLIFSDKDSDSLYLLHDPIQYLFPDGFKIRLGNNVYVAVTEFYSDSKLIPKTNMSFKKLDSGTKISCDETILSVVEANLSVDSDEEIKITFPKGTKLQQVDTPIKLILDEETIFTSVTDMTACYEKIGKIKLIDNSKEFLNCVSNQDFNMIKAFLKKGIKVDIDRAFGISARNGYLDIAKLLLSKGANVHYDNGYALRMASEYGHIEIVKLLLEKEVDVQVCNNYSIQWSACHGHTEIVSLLLKKGANPHIRDNFAFISSAERGHFEIVKLLLENGANINADNGYALRWSARNGHTEIVRLLIEKGADVHVMNDCAIQWSAQKGHYEVVKLLLENGADPRVDNQIALNENEIRKHGKVYDLLMEWCQRNPIKI
jgi:ankyrin repeat protein